MQPERTPARQWVFLGVFVFLFLGTAVVFARIGSRTLVATGTLVGLTFAIGAVLSAGLLFATRNRPAARGGTLASLAILFTISSALLGGFAMATLLLLNAVAAANPQTATYSIESLTRTRRRGVETYTAEVRYHGELLTIPVDGNAFAAKMVDLTTARGLFGFDVVQSAAPNLGIHVQVPPR